MRRRGGPPCRCINTILRCVQYSTPSYTERGSASAPAPPAGRCAGGRLWSTSAGRQAEPAEKQAHRSEPGQAAAVTASIGAAARPAQPIVRLRRASRWWAGSPPRRQRCSTTARSTGRSTPCTPMPAELRGEARRALVGPARLRSEAPSVLGHERGAYVQACLRDRSAARQ